MEPDLDYLSPVSWGDKSLATLVFPWVFHSLISTDMPASGQLCLRSFHSLIQVFLVQTRTPACYKLLQIILMVVGGDYC